MKKKIISCPNCGENINIPVGMHIEFICPQCNETIEFHDSIDKNLKDDETLEMNSEVEENSNNILIIITWILAIPIFIILNKVFPNPDWIFNLDRIFLLLSMIITFKLIEFTLKILEPFIVVLFFIGIIYLVYGSISGGYGFGSIMREYQYILYSMIDSPKPHKTLLREIIPFRNKTKIKNAIDYNNKEVRNYALNLTKDFEKEAELWEGSVDRTIIQSFAIFKHINNNWNYVNDPKMEEYYAKASETLHHLSGDCDDHAIFMAACIKAIGGEVRLVRTKGHIYPELLIGNRNDTKVINFLIKQVLFKSESYGKKLSFHIDEKNKIWINLDYTEKYPGGDFMSKEIFGILNLP